MTRVNVVGAVEILADDLGVVSALFGRQLSACATFALDGNGSGLSLDLIDRALSLFVGSKRGNFS